MECDSFDFTASVDDYGDPLVIGKLHFEDESLLVSKLDEYANICVNEGYAINFETRRDFDSESFSYIEYDLYYADKNISSTLGIELQFLIGGENNGKECIGIFAFNYPVYDKNAWPSNLVIEVLGHDVPHLPENGYTYQASLNTDSESNLYVDMVISNTTYQDELDYLEMLQTQRFVINDEEYDEYGFFAYSPDRTYVIQFKYTDYGLEIYIFKSS